MSNTVLTAVGYGLGVGLEVPDSEVAAARTWLPWWWQDVAVEPKRIWLAPSADACEMVVRELELWVAEHAVDRVFVHAGVVAIDGRALLLPGRSFTGKTTLVAALLRAGAAYGSDEYAVLDEDGHVYPYPRPLSLRETNGSRRRLDPKELGAEAFDTPLPVMAVASLSHVQGEEFKVVEISEAAAVLALLDNTVCAKIRPAAALAACAAAVSSSRLVSGVRDDADRAAGHVVDLLSTSHVPK